MDIPDKFTACPTQSYIRRHIGCFFPTVQFNFLNKVLSQIIISGVVNLLNQFGNRNKYKLNFCLVYAKQSYAIFFLAKKSVVTMNLIHISIAYIYCIISQYVKLGINVIH